MSLFDSMEVMPEDPIFGLPVIFAAEPRLDKVNLGIGSYKDDAGKPVVLNSVKQAEARILSKNLDKEYLPIQGNPDAIRASLQLLFGSDWDSMDKGRVFGMQTIGGTGALRIGGDFLARNVSKNIYLSDPTWPNHAPIFTRAGMTIHHYPYYQFGIQKLDFAGMCAAIEEMPPRSVILLQASCHNPTGFDPNASQWKELCALIKKKQIFPFFDVAYQGFGQGIDEDVAPIREFVKAGIELFVMMSYSKNFGLYGERVGTLVAVTENATAAKKLGSHLKLIVRGSYSNPPLHGSRILATILDSEDLKMEWKHEVQAMRTRIKSMRRLLAERLEARGGKERFEFLEKQAGMFSYCGLTPEEVERMRKEFAIYTPASGRINVAGINTQNIDYVSNALFTVMGI